MKALSLRALSGMKDIPCLLVEIEGHSRALLGKLSLHAPSSARDLLSHLYRDTTSSMLGLIGASRTPVEKQGIALERRIRDKIEALDSRHNMVIESIAELKQRSPLGVDSILTEQLMLTTLLQHSYHLTSKRHYHATGCVHVNAELSPILQGARAQAVTVAEHHFVNCPEIQLQLPDKPVRLTCIPSHVNFLLQEIFKNALHATLQQAQWDTSVSSVPIEVVVEDGPDAVRITTTDHGVGMSRDMAEQATHFLAQARNDPVSLTESQASYQPMSAPLAGLGAGLSLSKIYVGMFGGSLTVSSPGLGLGAVVQVQLPRNDQIEWRLPTEE